MAIKLTITKREIQSQVVEQVIAFVHVPGETKWLHFIYDIGHGKLTFRIRRLGSSGEQVHYFDDVDQAVEAYNKQ